MIPLGAGQSMRELDGIGLALHLRLYAMLDILATLQCANIRALYNLFIRGRTSLVTFLLEKS
jgi:hypothetical protein